MDTESRMAALELELQRLRAPQGRGQRFERDTYYRRPEKGEHAGWIVTGPTISGTSARDFAARGFLSLEGKYGTIPHNEENKWRKILSHPDGPSEFPADQVLTLRWYREPPVPGVRFPQIAGMKVVEYKCPDCEDRRFPAFNGQGGVDGLARHLITIHGYDRMALQRFGDAVGIDFTVVNTVIETVEEYLPDAADSNVATCDECDWTSTPGKDPEKSLRFHKMGAHKPVEVETVG